MARELRRLLITPDRLNSEPSAGQARPMATGADDRLVAATQEAVPLREAERHYLRRVLRLRDGERVAVVNGCGSLWTARLLAGERLLLEQPLAAPLQREPAPLPALGLALALPRRDLELVWRMATELGIDRLQPLLAERCAPSGEPPLERWRSVVAEACEQSERLWLPALEAPLPAAAFLAGSPCGVGLLATTRREGLPLLAARLATLGTGKGPVLVAVGPEGGWSPAEEEAAERAGWQAVSLGSTILRSGTAAVAVAAQLAAWRSLRSVRWDQALR